MRVMWQGISNLISGWDVFTQVSNAAPNLLCEPRLNENWL